MLTVSVEHLDEMAILRCRGRIVSGDETALLCAALAQEQSYVSLDLAEVSAIDAAGIGVLVSLQAAGVYLQLLNPTPQVREVLKVTQLDSIFEISGSHSTDKVEQEVA
jgi:anti-anti-sigma factor